MGISIMKGIRMGIKRIGMRISIMKGREMGLISGCLMEGTMAAM